MSPDNGAEDRVGRDGSTSRSLLASAKRDEPLAWERVVRLYAPLVASWCRRAGVAEQDLGDLLQDVFTAVAGHLNRFRKEGPGDTFRGWLLTIVRNKVRDYYRRRAGEPAAAGGTEAALQFQQIPDPNALDDVPECSNELLCDELLLNALESIRSEFHERTWQAFWCVVVEGRTAADAGAEMDMKPGTVRVAKSRVLMRLRRELGGAMG
jgi:RNA polymerase sigma-70 factor (ECF subfamily)